MNLNPLVSEYIQEAPEDQVEIMEEIRMLIHENVPYVSEEIKWGFPVFGAPKDFTYLRYSKKHVTLGFYHFEKIHDPNDLLEGSGKTMRHIKIFKKSEIDKELLSNWLLAVVQS